MSIMGVAIAKEKQQEINDFLIGYWENDIWSTDHSAFDEFRQTIWNKTYKKIDFSGFKSKIKAEIKFFILNRLKVDDVRLYQTVIKRYAASFKHISKLLNQFYPYIKSILKSELTLTKVNQAIQMLIKIKRKLILIVFQRQQEYQNHTYIII